jgi:hypothetical protein
MQTKFFKVRLKRRGKGFCNYCSTKQVIEGKRYCESCKCKLEKKRLKKVAKANESGLCKQCALRPRIEGLVKCEECRLVGRRRYDRLKTQVFNGYGNICACCQLDDVRFLSIDHVLNNGAHERKVLKLRSGEELLRRIIRESFPPTSQLLCFNCNFAKGLNGGICPHKSSE